MKLKKISIRKYRSIKELNELDINEKITCFVGGNECGKSNILKAINRLSKQEEDTPFSTEDPYKYGGELPEIHLTFKIENEPEIKALINDDTVKEFTILRIGEKISCSLDQDQKDAETASVNSENPTDGQETPLSKKFNQLRPLLPKIIYFPSFEAEELITGIDIPISELTANPPSLEARTILDFLSIGGITIESLQLPSPRERSKRITHGSAIIGKTLTNLWKQEDVKVRVEVSDSKLVISFRDGKNLDENDDTTWIWACPEDRSSGFRWFVTFYSRFLANSLEEVKNSIILLDDPGLFLHAEAQKDLQNTIEELAERGNQVLYTTHSPYLLNLENLSRIYLVEKLAERGTAVSRNWSRRKDWELPEPLKSIGFTYRRQVLQKKNLIVEGQADQTLLVGISKIFSEKGLSSLKLRDIIVFPVGGAPNSVAYGLLAKEEGLRTFVLVDSDLEGISARDRCVAGGLNAATLRDAAGGQNRKVTIEDFLPFDKYINSVNTTHMLYYDNWVDLSLSDFESSNPPRVLKIEQKIREKLGIEDLKEPLKKDLVAQKLLDDLKVDDFPEDCKVQLQELFRTVNSKLR